MNILKPILFAFGLLTCSLAHADQTVTYQDGDTNSTPYTSISTLFLSIASGTATQSGIISGSSSGYVAKQGDGTLILTGANTYSGPTVLSGGILSLGSSGALGSTSTIFFSGGTLQYSSANSTDYSSLFSTVANEQYRVDTNGQNVTWATPLTSSGGSLVKFGTGTLTLSGANAYSGDTIVTNGALALSGTTSLTSSGTLNVGYNANDNGTLNISQGAHVSDAQGNIANDFTQGTVTVNGSGSSWTNTGGLTVGGGGNGTLTISNGGQVSDTQGIIGGGGGSEAIPQGSVTVNGSGSSWTNTGSLTVGNITPGTLTISNGGLVSSGNFTVGNRGTGTLTISDGGQLSDTQGTIGLVGTATVDGSGSSWSNSGSLTIGNFNGQFTISNGAQVSAHDMMIGGGILNVGPSVTVAGSSLTVTSQIVVWQSSNLTVTGAGASVSAGEIDLGKNNFFTAPGTMTVSGGAQVFAVGYLGNDGGTTGILTVTDPNSTWNGVAVVGVNGNGTLTVANGAVVQPPGESLELAQQGGSVGTLNIGNGGAAGFVTATSVDGGAGTAVVNFNENDASYTFAPILTGSLSVSQVGTGTTVLTQANTYTGGTNLNAGTLSLGGSGVLGTTGTISFNGGTLQYTFYNTTDYSARFSTADNQQYKVYTNFDVTWASALASKGGSLTKLGAGALTLLGTNTYSGGTTISGGELVAGTASALPSGTTGADYTMTAGSLELNGFNLTMSSLSGPKGVIVLGSANLTVNQTTTTTFGGAISGAGGFTKLGTGTLTLSATSQFDGALSPNEGTLNITGNVTSGATSGIATTGTTATLNITGSGANWTSNNDTLMGDNGGTGNLNITGGATASDTFSLVGRHFGGTGNVTVDGAGSTWTHSAGLVIGTGGTGTMLVENGGQVSNTDGTIGGDSNSSGTVRVTGANSLWTSTSLVVGGNGTGVLAVDNGGTVQVGSTGTGVITLGNSGTASGTLNIGAAVGQTALDPGTILAASVTGGAGTGGNLVNFNHTGTGYAFAPDLTGNLSVQQNGGVTLLTGTNTYSGGTAVNSGTLTVENNSALGTGAVNVGRGATLQINSGFQVANTINLSGGSLAQGVVAGAQFSALHNWTSTLRGGTPTTAQLLDGQSSGNVMITGSFSHLLGDTYRISDVLSLSGVAVVNGATGQTDTFVLQLKLDPSLLDTNSYLGWLNPNTNQWVNAVLGNIGGTANFVDGAYDPSSDFVLGTYGLDLADGTVWAVLDHNSDFAVSELPEPGTWLLFGLGLGALVLWRKTRLN